jgi:ribosomal protein L37AE/L43A
MSKFLKEYIDAGLSKIVVLSVKEKEVESGYNPELTWETVVAVKGSGFVEAVAEEKVSFNPGASGCARWIDSERVISAEEYRQAARGKAILDTPAALANLQEAKDAVAAGYARQAELRTLRAPLHAKLDAITPKCPSCDKTMSLKEKNGRRFWACGRYPRNCDGGGIANLTAEANRLLAEIAKIGS